MTTRRRGAGSVAGQSQGRRVSRGCQWRRAAAWGWGEGGGAPRGVGGGGGGWGKGGGFRGGARGKRGEGGGGGRGPGGGDDAQILTFRPNTVHFEILIAAVKSIRTIGSGVRGRSG